MGSGLAVGVEARGQSPARQDLPSFGTGVQVVAVPVFVTDKSAKAVPGLTAADFEIEDQKKKVPIVAFEAVDAAAALDAPAAGPLVAAAARRQLLFLFDLAFSSPAGLSNARDAAVKLVRTELAPGDLAAAATYSPSGIRILVGFTSDREQLAAAISDLGLQPPPQSRDPFHLAWDMGLDFTRYSSEGLFPLPDALVEGLRTITRVEGPLYRQSVDAFIDGLRQLGQMLEGLQGRKHVLLLSAGFDQTLLQGAQGQERGAGSEAVATGRLWDVQSDRYFGDSTARDHLQRLYQSLSASDTVIHTVDVTSLTAGGAVDQERPGGTKGRETLAELALGTGGHFVRDANDLAAGMGEVLAATRHYYVLAFEPTNARVTGKLRKLTVRVKHAGLSVSHRTGYILPDPRKAPDDAAWQLQAAETIAKGLTGGTLAMRAVAVPHRDGHGRTRLSVVLEIDGPSLDAGTGQELRLEVYGYAIDGAGRIHDVLTVSPVFDLQAVGPSLRKRGVQVITSFAAPEGLADLRFLVRDVASGRGGALRIRTSVPVFENAGLTLSPLLFVDDPRARLVVSAASRANPSLEIPFRLEGRAFTADLRPVLARGAKREVCVMARRGVEREPGLPYAVTAELVGTDGPKALALVGSPRVFDDADGFQRVVLTLDPGLAPPGDYELLVRLRDPANGEEASSRAQVAVTR